jgi:hypothetical protein
MGDISVIFRNNLNEFWDFTSMWVLIHPRMRSIPIINPMLSIGNLAVL